jgi:dihydropteroate synthase
MKSQLYSNNKKLHSSISAVQDGRRKNENVKKRSHFHADKSRQENAAWAEYGIDLSVLRIMGIINVTPDSFSDGGKYRDLNQVIEQIKFYQQQGIDIIDIGGESSRPGAESVPEYLELQRVIPVIQSMRKFTRIPVSIDTCKAKVADQAMQTGANWINDISGLRADAQMIHVAKKWDCPVIVMHIKGNPKTMQKNPHYSDVIGEIMRYFDQRINYLHKYGISKIILDPGIGFGKRLPDNLSILRNLSKFKQFNYPLMIGASRKSFIGEITGRDVNHRMAGSISSAIWSVLQGVHIVRVHDVAETVDALKVLKFIREG